ncbi:Charged multivesicular body protein 2A [Haplosporangium bisporale]|nr:Charged multivesicular body protein 2A [Haplosporangium bisporale]
MNFLFGRRSPAEALRAHQRALSKAQRELDRERMKLEQQEKKIIVDIKKSAKAGQMNAAKVMAKDLVRTRRYIQKFYQMKTQLQAVGLRIQGLRSNQQMAEAMKGATKAMGAMNRNMNLPQIQHIMMEFEKESEIMDMKEEMMSDTIDEAMEEEEDEEEQDAIVNQVLDEIGINLDESLANAPGTSIKSPAGKERIAQAEGMSADDAALQARLDNLRREFCPYAARAVLAMAETKQAHEVVQIDLNTPRPDWYLHINPYGQVPALKIDDKDVLFESLIVAEYISDLHPEAGLFPQDPLQRAQIRYLVQHWGARTQPAYHKAAFTIDESTAKQRHQDFITELEKVDELLRHADRKGSVGQYFLGEIFSFADLALASFLTRIPMVEHFQTGFKFPTAHENPKLARFIEWREAVIARPSVKTLPSKEELAEIYKKTFLKKA